jgi:transposase-like protein
MGRFRFWKALPQVYPTTRRQPCWVHKTANVLDKLPKSMQGRVKSMLHDIYRVREPGVGTESLPAVRPVFPGQVP